VVDHGDDDPARDVQDVSGIERPTRLGHDIDLGDAALIVPGGRGVARQALRSALRDHYEAAVASLADPDLSDQ
jgi:hypothetical protein